MAAKSLLTCRSRIRKSVVRVSSPPATSNLVGYPVDTWQPWGMVNEEDDKTNDILYDDEEDIGQNSKALLSSTGNRKKKRYNLGRTTKSYLGPPIDTATIHLTKVRLARILLAGSYSNSINRTESSKPKRLPTLLPAKASHYYCILLVRILQSPRCTHFVIIMLFPWHQNITRHSLWHAAEGSSSRKRKPSMMFE